MLTASTSYISQNYPRLLFLKHFILSHPVQTILCNSVQCRFLIHLKQKNLQCNSMKPDPENVSFLPIRSQANLFGLKTCFKTIKHCMLPKHVLLPYNIFEYFLVNFEIFLPKSVSILCGDHFLSFLPKFGGIQVT